MRLPPLLCRPVKHSTMRWKLSLLYTLLAHPPKKKGAVAAKALCKGGNITFHSSRASEKGKVVVKHEDGLAYELLLWANFLWEGTDTHRERERESLKIHTALA